MPIEIESDQLAMIRHSMMPMIIGAGLWLSLSVVRADDGPFPLWAGDLPVPKSADLTPLAAVEFHVIKPWVPEQDGYHWLHGVALAWHEGKLVASLRCTIDSTQSSN